MSSKEYKEALVRSFQKTKVEEIPESKEVAEIVTSLQTLKISNGKLCGFCKKEVHIPKLCPEFKKYKDKCSNKSMVFSKPSKRDLNGYCSSGVLVYGKYNNETYILMISEAREGVFAFNFPGGKREYRNEKPRQCALREMSEELKDCPNEVFNQQSYKITKSLYLWHASSKYFLIPLEYTFPTELIIDDKYKWVNIKDIGKENIYPFAREIINTFELGKDDNICYQKN